MSSASTYSREYIAGCRKHVDAQLASYLNLVDGATPEARAAFEEQFWGNLVLVLELMFVHRQRAKEGRDGNPMNEVRFIAASIVEHDGVFTVDRSTRLKSSTSVLGFEPGERIVLDADRFARLSAAYFAAVESAFGE